VPYTQMLLHEKTKKNKGKTAFFAEKYCILCREILYFTGTLHDCGLLVIRKD
jgi:hypothetical protein